MLPPRLASARSWHLDPVTWLALLGFSALRAVLLPAFELMPQDAYYFFYAEHLSLSYLDHPPMIGWLLWGFAQVLGKSELTIRLAAFSLTLLAQVAFAFFARPFLARTGWNRGLFLLACSQLLTTLSLIATPDVPLVLFWALALWALERAIFGGRRWAWPLAGVAMGLALDSKYTAGLLVIGLGLYLVLAHRHRFYLKTPWPYLTLAIAAVLTLPVWLWNVRHDFASFAYQTSFRAETLLSPTYRNLLGLIATQVYLLIPPLFFLLVVLVWKHGERLVRRRALPGARTLFLLCFFAPGFVGFFSLTAVFWIKINWIGPAYLSAYVLAARYADKKFRRWMLFWSLVFHLALAIELAFYPVPVRGDDTWFGWRQLAAQVEQRAAEHPEAFLFSEDGYKTTAQLNFHLDRRVYGPELIGDPRFHFRYAWGGLGPLVGRDGLLIDSVRVKKNGDPGAPPPPEIVARFDAVEEQEPIRIFHRGEEVRRFRVYLCRGYRGPGTPTLPPP